MDELTELIIDDFRKSNETVECFHMVSDFQEYFFLCLARDHEIALPGNVSTAEDESHATPHNSRAVV